MPDLERLSMDGESMSLRVLLIEDNLGDAVLIEQRLKSTRDTHFLFHHVDRLSRGLTHLDESETDVVLLDLNLPDARGLGTVETVHERHPGLPIVVLTGLEDRKLGTLAIRSGAQDYLSKAMVSAELLSRTIVHAIERQDMLRELTEYADELRHSENRLQTVLDEHDDGIVLLDAVGIVLYANQAAETILGRPRGDLLDRALDPSLGIPLDPGQPAGPECEIHRENAPDVIAALRISETEWEGQPVRLVSLRDITERKQSEAIRRSLAAKQMVLEQLREITEMQRQFIDVVTHELRTPMTAIRSSVTMLLDGTLGELQGKQAQFLDMIQRNTDRLIRFSTDVLSLSRLDSDRYPIHPAEYSLDGVVRPTMDLIRPKGAEKKIAVLLDEESLRGLHVFADSDAVAQVVTNLVGNVIAHCPPGTSVALSARPRGEHFVRLSVADDGPGIPGESLARIFERFYQSGRKSGPGYRGSGIGLTVCRALVERMGGNITVQSREGEGTSFQFTLPTAAARDEVLFGRIAVLMGLLREEQLSKALEAQADVPTDHRRMGEILVDMGYLTGSQVEEVLESQQTSFSMPHPRLKGHNRGEVLLGRLAVSRGFVTDEQLNEGLRIQETLRESGLHLGLGQILLEQGYLSLDDTLELLQLQGLGIGSCPHCGGRFNIERTEGDGPAECPRCGSDLDVLAQPDRVTVDGASLDGE